ncbi:MAG: SpoIIE family protein phosphatase [Clostridia bacterium]|nr:SpoIIE family protein phosphatase [Clostridia bacterium]
MKNKQKGLACIQAIGRQLVRDGTILNGMIGFFLARVVIYGAFAPFGVAFLPIVSGRRLLAAVVGVCAGTVSRAATVDCLRYLAAAVMSTLLKRILQPLTWSRRITFAVGLTVLAIGTTGLVWLSTEGGSMLATLCLSAELLLSACATGIFGCAFDLIRKRRGIADREKRLLAALVTAALCATSLPTVSVGDTVVSVGRIAAAVAVLAAGYSARLYGGVFVGLLVGLTMDLTTAVSPIYTALYALGGVAVGCVPRKRRWQAAAYLVVTVAAVALLPQNVRITGTIWESAAAATLFTVLPRRYLALLPHVKSVGTEAHYEARLRRHMQAKLHGLAEVYEDVAKTVGTIPADSAVDEVEQFALACEMVCGTCQHWPLCCMEIAADKAAIRRMLARGSAEPEDFCTALRTRCPQLDAFCTCVTFSLRAGRERRLRSGCAAEARAVLSEQYGQIAALLDDEAIALSEDLRFERELERSVKKTVSRFGIDAEVIAYRDSAGQFHVELCAPTMQPLMARVDELAALLSQETGTPFGPPEQLEGRHLSCLSFTQLPAFACRIGATAEKRRGEAISGDCGTYFRGKNGCLYVILCDGMGSGTAAHEEAVRTVRLLESFLRAGIAPANAAEIIRSAANVRTDGEQFATIDVAVIDPRQSTLQTVKYRAAPTYLRRKRGDGYTVRIIGAQSSIAPDLLVSEAVKLVEGDMILLTSDGVTAACSCGDFCNCLVKLNCDHPRELSELVIKMARTDGECDDRTVIALSYEKTAAFV